MDTLVAWHPKPGAKIQVIGAGKQDSELVMKAILTSRQDYHVPVQIRSVPHSKYYSVGPHTTLESRRA